MKYLKTVQFVPGKGNAWIYYELGENDEICRFVTVIPETGEQERVANPVVRKLFRPEMCAPASEEEFKKAWGE